MKSLIGHVTANRVLFYSASTNKHYLSLIRTQQLPVGFLNNSKSCYFSPSAKYLMQSASKYYIIPTCFGRILTIADFCEIESTFLRERMAPHTLIWRKSPDIVVILSSLDLYQSLLVCRFGVAGNAFILVFAN
jgi:hypothetical protein